MEAPNPLEMACHIDRVRRRMASCRGDIVIRELSGGWITLRPGGARAEFPSQSQDRAFWLTLSRPLTQTDLEEAREAARTEGIGRLFMWVSPVARTPEAAKAIEASGAKPWPHVEYIALARRGGPCEPRIPTTLSVRVVGGDEVDSVLRAAEGWYSSDGVAAARKLIVGGICEMHAAFDGDAPVAIGMLTLDGGWAYLGAAGTAPEHRRRGAQSSLICSRVRRGGELGAAWCTCETNTTVPISLRNLVNCGFVDRIRWHVYVWDHGGG